jgi:hypothetical protein
VVRIHIRSKNDPTTAYRESGLRLKQKIDQRDKNIKLVETDNNSQWNEYLVSGFKTYYIIKDLNIKTPQGNPLAVGCLRKIKNRDPSSSCESQLILSDEITLMFSFRYAMIDDFPEFYQQSIKLINSFLE